MGIYQEWKQNEDGWRADTCRVSNTKSQAPTGPPGLRKVAHHRYSKSPVGKLTDNIVGQLQALKDAAWQRS